MGKDKRTNLPPVTADDVERMPERVRRTANGWAWKCAYCGQFASSETQAGKYVCSRHGGVTEKQRDPVERQRAVDRGEPPPRPPGRPMKTMFYSKAERVRVDEIVEEYRAQGFDPDFNDDNMLYLHAYVEDLKRHSPDINEVMDALTGLLPGIEEWLQQRAQNEGARLSVNQVLDQLGDLQNLLQQVRAAERLYSALDKFIKDMEKRHQRIVVLGKTRAETRLKNAAASQLDLFSKFMENLSVILNEQLPSEYMEPLQKRFEKELSEVPINILDGSASLEA